MHTRVLSQWLTIHSNCPAKRMDQRSCGICWFYKYHCELNCIEQIWGWLKERCRKSCSYRFKDLQLLVTDIIDNQLLLAFVRKAYRKRFMDGYVICLTGTCLDFIVKMYKGHRVVPIRVIEALGRKAVGEILRQIMPTKCSKKRKRVRAVIVINCQII